MTTATAPSISPSDTASGFRAVDGAAAGGSSIAFELTRIADKLTAGEMEISAVVPAVASVMAAYGTDPTAEPDPLVGYQLLADRPPPHDPVFDGLFDRHALVEIVGPSKARKSYAAMQIALCLATGRPAFGFDVRKSLSVCIADFELKADDLHRRMWRMGRALSITADDVAHRIRVLPLAGVANPIPIIERHAAMFDVLIVDPLYALCDGPETIEFMREPMRWLRRLATTKAAVCFLHHDAKGTPGDRDTRDRGSGSNITGRSVDARITITPAAADPDGTAVMGFMCRSYKTPASTAWRFEDDAFRPSDLPAEPERQPDRRSRQSRPKSGQYHEAALRILSEHGPMQPRLFKARLREELNMAKHAADDVVAQLTIAGGQARAWHNSCFPAQYFVGLVSQVPQHTDREGSET